MSRKIELTHDRFANVDRNKVKVVKKNENGTTFLEMKTHPEQELVLNLPSESKVPKAVSETENKNNWLKESQAEIAKQKENDYKKLGWDIPQLNRH